MGVRKLYERVSKGARKNRILKKLVRRLSYIQMNWEARYDDEKYAKKMYRRYNDSELNLTNPKTFNEKLWWLKYHYRNPLQKICSDKYRLREYVHECGLDDILVPIYGVYETPEKVPLESFDKEVFIKINVGTGGNILYDPHKPFDRSFFIWDFSSRLSHNCYLNSREWNFKDVPGCIVCEKVLRDKSGELPKDWKFMCFNGEPRLVFYSSGVCDETGRHSVTGIRYTNVYDMNFEYVPIVSSYPTRPEIIIEEPSSFELMIKYARILSKPFPHCRVDFYNIEGKVYLGEITFYHSGGCGNIEPKEWAERMGSWIDITNIPREFLV